MMMAGCVGYGAGGGDWLDDGGDIDGDFTDGDFTGYNFFLYIIY